MTCRNTLLLGLTVAGAITPVAQADLFGADAFGYSAIDNVNQPDGPTFSFFDISGSGELLTVGDDEVSDRLTLPIAFVFYGVMHNKVVVSTNGFLGFDIDTSPDPLNDCPLPQPVIGNAPRVYLLNDDLVSAVYFQHFDVSPVSHPDPAQPGLAASIFQWSAQHFPSSRSFDFQVVLYENDDLLMQFARGNVEDGFSSTTGIQNALGTIGLTIHCNTPDSIPDGYAVLIKPYPDCNRNFIPDDVDIDMGDSLDCNANGIPDECDIDPTDPDGDGLVSPDCNINEEPDECEGDCNSNGVPDDCDVDPSDPDGDGFVSADCNGNIIPDECEVDCNGNGVPDDCDIDVSDPDGDGFVSEDCNGNGVPDECDIASGVSLDCNENGVPDACDIDASDPDGDGFVSGDCNGNLIPDECDIASGFSLDCNDNGVPDDCDLAAATSPDCNGNLIPDECDVASGFSPDCNENGVPDDCDVAAGSSPDCNANGIPDECEEDCNFSGVPDDCDTEPEYDPDPAGVIARNMCADAEYVGVGDDLIYDADTLAVALQPGLGSGDVLRCGVYIGAVDVWYRYRASWDGDAYISVQTQTDDLRWVAAIYDGCPDDGGERIACNTGFDFIVLFNVERGREYFIRLGGVKFGAGVCRMWVTGPDDLRNPDDANRNRVPDICECLADVNDDGVVDELDAALVLLAFGPCPGCPEDVDGSGVVDTSDWFIVIGSFGDCGAIPPEEVAAAVQ